MYRTSVVAGGFVAAAMLVGCGGGSAPPAGDAAAKVVSTPVGRTASDGTVKDQPKGEIVVFAETPLTKAFQTLGRRFHSAHPDVTVHFRFGASAALAAALAEGTVADVFAVASAATMQALVNSGSFARGPTAFARGRPSTAAGDGYQIAPLADSSNIVTAAAFVDWVLSLKGRQVLKAAGFEPA